MARKRMIDPGIWTSEDFSSLSMLARLVWVGLISNADDEGRGRANIAYLKSQLFPYDDELSLKKIENALKEIEKLMSIRFYEVENKKYYQLTKWAKFQNINRPSPSQIPKMPENTESCKLKINENSTTVHTPLTECSLNTHTSLTDSSVPKKEIEVEYEVEVKEESVKEESGTSPLSTHPQKHKYGKYKNVLLTEDEYNRLLTEQDGEAALEYFSEYRERKGYKCKSDNLSIRKWVFDALQEERQRKQRLECQQPQQSKSTQQKVSNEEANAWK